MINKVKHSKRVIGAPNCNKEKSLEPNTAKEWIIGHPTHSINFLYYYMYMETVCEEIKEDMKNIEADSKKIDCYAILGRCPDARAFTGTHSQIGFNIIITPPRPRRRCAGLSFPGNNGARGSQVAIHLSLIP